MSQPSADRNLLFGMLAMQMDFITREQLIAAMQAWVFEKHRPLGAILVQQNALADDNRGLLELLVQKHLAHHDNNTEKSLAAMGPAANVRSDLDRITDPDVQASLTLVPAPSATPSDPYATMLPTAQPVMNQGPRFRIVRPHARGGLGEVYVARDEELHREVALKEIQDQQADNQESRSRFMLEAEITGGLEHPGIVPVYGLGTYADGRPYYAMRFIRGDSLKEAIEVFHKADQAGMDAGQRALQLRALLGRFVDVCNAIAYAHSRGILHRDLKPGNIMLGKYGETLVVDWGLAKPMGEPGKGTAPSLDAGEGSLMPSAMSLASHTLVGAAVGTPQYMSPEQAAGRLDLLGPASDVYSLGATLYCILTAHAPIPDVDVNTVLQKVQRGDIRRPRDVKPDVSAPLEAICLKAMAVKPDDRYPTPKELADDLEHWLADEPISACKEPWTITAKRWIGRHAALVTGIFTAIAIALMSLIGTTVLLTAANERERQAKLQAEENFQLARSAVDQYHTNVSEDVLLKEPGMEPLRKKLLQSAQEFYAKFVQERAGDPRLQSELGKATFRLAQITGDIDSPKKAIELHQQAAKLFETIPIAEKTDGFRNDQAACFHHLGRLHREAGEVKASEAAYLKALALWETLLGDHPHDEVLQAGLARTHMGLGNLHQFARRLDDAQTHYQHSLKQWDALAKAHPDNAQYRRDRAANSSNLGQVYSSLADKQKDAEASLRLALTLQKKLVEDSPNISKYHDELARTWYLLGNLSIASADPATDPRTAFQEAAGLWQTAVHRHPTVVIYQIRLADAYAALAKAHARAMELKLAEDAGRQAVNIMRRLSESKQDDPRHRSGLAQSLTALGDLYRANQQIENAEIAYLEAIDIQDKLTREQTQVPHFQRDLATTFSALGRLHQQTANSDKANDAFKKAVAAWDALVHRYPGEQEYAAGLAETCFDLGNVNHFAAKHKDAHDWYSRALLAFDAKKLTANGSVATIELRRNTYLMRASTLTRMNRFPEALEDMDRTLALTAEDRKPAVRLVRAGSLARAGRYVEAGMEVEKLKSTMKGDEATYAFAGVYALAAGAVGTDERLSDEERQKLGEPYALDAMKLLRGLADAGYFKAAGNRSRLKSDPDFLTLRARPEFKQWTGDAKTP
jgi:serine/threonine protein kinase/tetratricopeptide (TPR) repeat protein